MEDNREEVLEEVMDGIEEWKREVGGERVELEEEEFPCLLDVGAPYPTMDRLKLVVLKVCVDTRANVHVVKAEKGRYVVRVHL